MAKNEKTEKANLRGPKGKERIKPVDPSVQTILAPCEPHDNSLAQKESHGKAKVVLLPVEPYTVHVYWELDSDGQKKGSKELGENFLKSQAILRFYDVTNIDFDGTNAHSFFDIPVDLSKRNCYVHLWSPQKTYFVDLGWRTEQERFFCLGRSNTAHTPSAWPAQGGAHLPGQFNPALVSTKGAAKTDEQNVLGSAKEHKPEQRPRILDSNEAPIQTTSANALSHGHVDLSAINENAFEPGVSSALMPSSPKRKDGQKD